MALSPQEVDLEHRVSRLRDLQAGSNVDNNARRTCEWQALILVYLARSNNGQVLSPTSDRS